MHAVEETVRGPIHGLPPVVGHVAGGGGVVLAEVVLPQVVAAHGLHGVAIVPIAQDGPLAAREVHGAVLGVHGQRSADRAVGGALAVLAILEEPAQRFRLARGEVVAEEVAARPGERVDAPAAAVHVHREHALVLGGHREVLGPPHGQVVGQQVAAGIGREAGGGNPHRLHAVHDRVEADVRREVEMAGGFDERDVALALRDGVAPLLSRGLVEVGHVPRPAHGRVEHEHLGGHVVALRAEHVVDAAVAGRPHPVVRVVRIGEAGVVHAGDEAARRPLADGARREAQRQRGERGPGQARIHERGFYRPSPGEYSRSRCARMSDSSSHTGLSRQAANSGA